MPRLFNLGLNQKHFGGNNKIAAASVNMGCTKGRGSTTRMFNYCKQHSSNPSNCINEFINIPNGPTILPGLAYLSETRGPASGTLNENFGWNDSGVWFSGNSEDYRPAYPIFSNFTIPYSSKVEVNVDFVYNDRCSDFGLCIYTDGTVPNWCWNYNSTRIACQYDCPNPQIYGQQSIASNENNLIIGNTYTCQLIYNPSLLTNSVTMNTFLGNDLFDSLHIDEKLTQNEPYRIGFTADQDNTDYRTYIKNLKISVNDGEAIYNSSLQNIIIPPFV
jgi:hypothetical protein